MSKPARRVLVAWTCVAAGLAWGADVSLYASTRASLEITSQVSSEVSSEASSRGSSHSSRGGTRPAAVKQGPDGAGCADHDDCQGWCQQGVCVGAQAQPQCTVDAHCGPGAVCQQGRCAAALQAGQCTQDAQCGPGAMCQSGACVAAPPPPGCQSDAQCGPGVLCRNGLCVLPDTSAPPPQPPAGGPPPPPPVNPPACTSDPQCPGGQVCLNGQCSPPPPPAMLRRGTEHLLRERVAQLQEDLALGHGPVIAALASAQGVSADALGQVLRAHRAELTALVGDARDDAWTGRFLRRVEALSLACPRA